MMFDKLFANCLLVNDFDKSLKFYRNILGLKVKDRDGKFANFVLDGASLAIFQKSEADAMFPKKHMGAGGGVVLAFQVKDVQKTCDELKNKGIDIFEGPKTTDWGQTVAYFKDPDDNIWEISNQ